MLHIDSLMDIQVTEDDNVMQLVGNCRLQLTCFCCSYSCYISTRLSCLFMGLLLLCQGRCGGSGKPGSCFQVEQSWIWWRSRWTGGWGHGRCTWASSWCHVRTTCSSNACWKNRRCAHDCSADLLHQYWLVRSNTTIKHLPSIKALSFFTQWLLHKRALIPEQQDCTCVDICTAHTLDWSAWSCRGSSGWPGFAGRVGPPQDGHQAQRQAAWQDWLTPVWATGLSSARQADPWWHAHMCGSREGHCCCGPWQGDH